MKGYNPLTTFPDGGRNKNVVHARFGVGAILSGIILLLLCSPSAYAADGTPVWTNYYVGRTGNEPQGIAVDSNANVVVTGDNWTIKYSSAGAPLWTNSFPSAAALAIDGSGNVLVTGSSGGDYGIIKYSGAGVPLWTNICAIGISGDTPAALAVDSSGNVFMTGYSAGSAPDYPTEYATIKFSGAGVPLWTNTFNGAGGRINDATAMAVDASGNVIVTGKASGSGSSYHYATIEYSGAGIPLWTNSFSGAGNSNDTATAVATDGNGNVVVTGDTFGNGSYYDFGTIKYSNSGVPLWTNIFNGPGNTNDYAGDVAVDSNGNVYVTGTATGTASGTGYATIKYSSAGVPIWTNFFQGAGKGFDGALHLALDGSGNAYVTGNSTPAVGALPALTTIKYSTAGAPVWTNAFILGGNNESLARGVVVDAAGNTYVTGYMEGLTLGYGYATIKYSAAGISPLTFITTNGNPVYSTNGFSLVLIGPAGSNAVISASSNLQTWVPVFTNPLVSGTLTFTDALATNYTLRFYRAALQ